MSEATKFIVTPFRKNGKKLVVAEQREARNADLARQLAERMSIRYVGVSAHQMTIDTDTGEISACRATNKVSFSVNQDETRRGCDEGRA